MDDFQNRLYALQSLLILAKSDSQVHQLEEEYILFVAQKLGFSVTNFDEVQSMSFESAEKPTHEADRMTVFYYILFFLYADKEINIRESNKAAKFGFQLGFSPDLVERMIARVIEHAGKNMDPKILIDEIVRSQN